jgi:hypothetical protein
VSEDKKAIISLAFFLIILLIVLLYIVGFLPFLPNNLLVWPAPRPQHCVDIFCWDAQ